MMNLFHELHESCCFFWIDNITKHTVMLHLLSAVIHSLWLWAEWSRRFCRVHSDKWGGPGAADRGCRLQVVHQGSTQSQGPYPANCVWFCLVIVVFVQSCAICLWKVTKIRLEQGPSDYSLQRMKANTLWPQWESDGCFQGIGAYKTIEGIFYFSLLCTFLFCLYIFNLCDTQLTWFGQIIWKPLKGCHFEILGQSSFICTGSSINNQSRLSDCCAGSKAPPKYLLIVS